MLIVQAINIEQNQANANDKVKVKDKPGLDLSGLPDKHDSATTSLVMGNFYAEASLLDGTWVPKVNEVIGPYGPSRNSFDFLEIPRDSL